MSRQHCCKGCQGRVLRSIQVGSCRAAAVSHLAARRGPQAPGLPGWLMCHSARLQLRRCQIVTWLALPTHPAETAAAVRACGQARQQRRRRGRGRGRAQRRPCDWHEEGKAARIRECQAECCVRWQHEGRGTACGPALLGGQAGFAARPGAAAAAPLTVDRHAPVRGSVARARAWPPPCSLAARPPKPACAAPARHACLAARRSD